MGWGVVGVLVDSSVGQGQGGAGIMWGGGMAIQPGTLRLGPQAALPPAPGSLLAAVFWNSWRLRLGEGEPDLGERMGGPLQQEAPTPAFWRRGGRGWPAGQEPQRAQRVQ